MTTFEQRQSCRPFTGLLPRARLSRISDVTVKADNDDISAASMATSSTNLVSSTPLKTTTRRSPRNEQLPMHPR